MADSSGSHVKKVLLGCTGSVATVKIPAIIQQLQELDIPVEVRVVTTEHALHFFNHTELDGTVYRDRDEWQAWGRLGDPVLHIELRRWADIMVIAPLDCNTLAKIAHGICDNLLTCIVRAWDVKKPLLFAPAMNTVMFEHPLTAQQFGVLQSFGYTIIPTVVKTLACGDTGDGAMAKVNTIIDMIRTSLQT